MKTLKLKHFILIGTAVLQIVLFVIFLARLFNGSIVRTYLEKGRYEKAVSVINKYDKLLKNEEIANDITNIIRTTKSDYLNGSLTYGQADKTISQFTPLEMDSCKNIIADADDCINAINSGDKAMNDHKFDEALKCYSNLSDDDKEIFEIKDEKIRSIYNAMSEELVKLAGEKKYSDIMSDIISLKTEISDKELLSQLNEWEVKYLAEWIELQCSNNAFTGTNGALQLAAEHDSLTGGSDSVASVDSRMQEYIMSQIGEQKYKEVLDSLDADFDTIKKYCDENTYNDFRVTCGMALLNQAQQNGEYIGSEGAIKLADKLNSYREGSVNKNVLINSLATRERYALIDKINATRTAAGLTEVLSDASLENSAWAMIDKVNNGSYDDHDLDNILKSNGVKYEKACCAWNGSAAYADVVFSKFTPIDDYGILTVNELTRIGVGMRFDEETQTFSWFIIETK